MFSPRFQATLTPTQFATYMANKSKNQQVVLLALKNGNVFVLADEKLPTGLLVRCTNIPMTLVPAHFTTKQFTSFLKASAEFYQWMHGLDQSVLQKRLLESVLQHIELSAFLPLAICLQNSIDKSNTVQQAA